jgi:endonuclease YncB( thermonuclease family)
LANVDAPERGKKGGSAATRALKGMIQGQEVSIDTVARDKYGRSVANVKVGRRSVNKAMRDKVKR